MQPGQIDSIELYRVGIFEVSTQTKKIRKMFSENINESAVVQKCSGAYR